MKKIVRVSKSGEFNGWGLTIDAPEERRFDCAGGGAMDGRMVGCIRISGAHLPVATPAPPNLAASKKLSFFAISSEFWWRRRRRRRTGGRGALHRGLGGREYIFASSFSHALLFSAPHQLTNQPEN